MTAIVIGLDLAVIAAFCVYLYSATNLIKKQSKVFDVNNLTVTDFAVRIENIPSLKKFGGNETVFKAALSAHIEKVVEK